MTCVWLVYTEPILVCSDGIKFNVYLQIQIKSKDLFHTIRIWIINFNISTRFELFINIGSNFYNKFEIVWKYIIKKYNIILRHRYIHHLIKIAIYKNYFSSSKKINFKRIALNYKYITNIINMHIKYLFEWLQIL